MADHILIRYGELALKKSNRKQFINRINKSIKRALESFENLEYDSRGLRFYIILRFISSFRVIKLIHISSEI